MANWRAVNAAVSKLPHAVLVGWVKPDIREKILASPRD